MRKLFWNSLGVITVIILYAILNFTTPTQAGPLGVLVFFTTLYVLVFWLLVEAVKLYKWLAGEGVRVSGGDLARGRLRLRRKDYGYAAVGAFAPLMLLMAQANGGVSWLGMALTVGFELVAGFLVAKRF